MRIRASVPTVTSAGADPPATRPGGTRTGRSALDSGRSELWQPRSALLRSHPRWTSDGTPGAHRDPPLRQPRWSARASAARASRTSGWAIRISARARSRRLCPNSSATPHSVTTVRTCARVVTTPAPSCERGDDPRDRPPLAVDGRAMIARPSDASAGAPDEVHLAADPAVQPVTDRVGDDLAGQVDLDRRVDGDHPAERPDDVGVVGEVDRAHLDHRVVVDEVVQPLGAHQERGHDLAPVALLAGAGDDAGLDQVDDRVGEHLGVDAEVALVDAGPARSPPGSPPMPSWRVAPSGTSSATYSPIRRSTSPMRPDRMLVRRDVALDREVDLRRRG